MEEFLKLKWSKKFPKQLRDRKDVYDCAFSDDEQDVFLCHINEINPEFYGRSISGAAQTSKARRATEQSSAGNGEIHLFRKFPTKSKIKRKIHISCIRILKKLEEQCLDSLPWQDADRKLFLSSVDVRKKEKAEFHEFVRNYFMTYLRHRILKIDQNLESILVDHWKMNVIKRVEERKVQNYQLQTALPMDHCLPEGEMLILNNPVEVFQSGTIPLLHLNFSNEEVIILDGKPEMLKTYLSETPRKTEDIIEMARQQDVDFILPLESIEKFLSGDKKNWIIPLNIQENYGKNVGILETPLPPLNMDTKQRNSDIYKYLFEMIAIAPIDISMDQSKSETVDMNSDSEDESNLVIDDICTEVQTIKSDTINTPPDQKHLQKINQGMQRSQNCNYKLFTLGLEQQSIRILLEMHQDAQINEENAKRINFSLKIDYQTEFGAEEITLENLIHEWCLLYFNINDKTLRVRVDSQTKRILSIKELSLGRIERDLMRLHNVSSKDFLSRLWGIFNVMKNFPPQNYLIHHDPSHGRKIMIYASRDTSSPDCNFLKLSEIYKKVDFKRQPLLEQHEWLPIDDQEVTVLHERNNVMPCAFPHWGQTAIVEVWNERRNLAQKYEARIEAKERAKIQREQQIKAKKKQKKRIKQKMKKLEKSKLKAKTLPQSVSSSSSVSGANVPEWFFDEDGRVKVHNIDDPAESDFYKP
ncbi:hypothetical protein DMENIID0001_103190 [Sergentomyia squamirostris]